MVDGTMNGLGWVTTRFSTSIKALQSGNTKLCVVFLWWNYSVGGFVHLFMETINHKHVIVGTHHIATPYCHCTIIL